MNVLALRASVHFGRKVKEGVKAGNIGRAQRCLPLRARRCVRRRRAVLALPPERHDVLVPAPPVRVRIAHGDDERRAAAIAVRGAPTGSFQSATTGNHGCPPPVAFPVSCAARNDVAARVGGGHK
eukprot:scaffold13320_cov118-Isochrysis_galbana.AAC.10